MKQDINTLTEELIKASVFSASGVGQLPPKLKYKLQKWLKSLRAETGVKQMDQRRRVETVKSELTAKVLEAMEIKELKKNEVMASAYSDGSVKMDFGSDVPSETKKAAMKWAKKRGLIPVEASLAKNVHSATTIFFGKDGKNPETSIVCEKRMKWEIPLN